MAAPPLFITGTSGADEITLLPSATGVLEVDIDGDGISDLSFDRSTFTAVDIQGRGGDDRVANRGQFPDEVITIDGGGGHDTLTGGLGNQTLIGGTGNDRFAWNPGDDNDVVEGEAGADVLDFNGSNAAETIDVSANGSRVRLLRNIANVNTDLGGVERIELDALGGSDTIVAGDTTGTELDTFAVNLAAFGGAGDAAGDAVIANGTDGADAVRISRSGAQARVTGLAFDLGADD
jgi:Ca2+-binding RTX toxin-like protein